MIRSAWLWCCMLLLTGFRVYALPDISMEVYRYVAESGPYIEVALYVDGTSLVCSDGMHTPYGIRYTLLITDPEGQVVAGNRYQLSSTGCPAKDIMDARRFTLPQENIP